MNLFDLLVIVHFISDWIFQTQEQASNKSKDLNVLLEHSSVYTIFFIPVLFFCQPLSLIWALPLLFLSHAFLDNRKFEFWILRVFKGIYVTPDFIPFYKDKYGDPQIFDKSLFWILLITIDQVLHIIVLAFVAALLIKIRM